MPIYLHFCSIYTLCDALKRYLYVCVCVRAPGLCGFGVFALINHQMLVIGLTLRVNISISD